MADQRLDQLTAVAASNVSGSHLMYTALATTGSDYNVRFDELDKRWLVSGSNLSDLGNAGTARTNLGLVAGGAGDIWVEKAGDTMTGDLTFSGQFHPAFSPGSDTDFNFFTGSVTGTPTVSWDESEDALSQNKGLRITSGEVGIGVTTPAALLDVEINAATDVIRLARTGVKSLTLDFANSTTNFETNAVTYWQTTSGQFLISDVRTDATQKNLRFGLQHYTNAEEPFYVFFALSSTTNNNIHIGGGTGLGNAATQISMYTAANNTTTTGTERFRVASNGRAVVGATTPLGQLHIDQADTGGTIPTLYLNQADVSEEMIEFNTTIGTGNAIEAIGSKTLTTTHFIKVTIPGGLTRYIPVGTIA